MLTAIELKVKKRKGYDLLQLLIWTAAVVVILAVAMPYYSDFQEKNKRSAATRELRVLAEACALYAALSKNSQPPANLGALATGLSASESNDGLAYANFITKSSFTSDSSSFVDPWGNPYTYSASTRTLSSTANGGTAITQTF